MTVPLKTAFEDALRAGVLAEPKNGRKWRTLQEIGVPNIRWHGVLHKREAERHARMRQLVTAGRHGGW